MIIHCPIADDFVTITSKERTYQPDTTTIPRCWVIVITNDNILESIETFSVELNTSDPDVILNPSSAVIRILNDDGMMSYTESE